MTLEEIPQPKFKIGEIVGVVQQGTKEIIQDTITDARYLNYSLGSCWIYSCVYHTNCKEVDLMKFT